MLRAVRARLVHRCRRNMAHFPLFVQNELREAADGATIDIEDPATGASIATCATAGPQDVASAVEAARSAWPAWRDLGAKKRATILRNAAAELRRRVPELCEVETRQTGRPRREYKAQLGRVPEWFEYHASLAETTEGAAPNFIGDPDHLCVVQRVPLGVCGLITPFNHPLLIASKKLAPCLATGNVAVVKPSELAPGSVLLLGEIFAASGAPPGVVNVLPGGADAATALAAHDDVARVDLTGGTAAGQALGAIAGSRGVSYGAELAGHAPLLVFDDVDLDQAVAGACFAAFLAAGQTCVSAKRIFIHRSIYDAFAAKLAARADQLRVGDPFSPETDVGPLVSAKALAAARAFVDASGAQILAGGSAPCAERGYFFRPTVLAGSVDLPCFREECFAPVVCIAPFDDEADAIAKANASAYALGAGVWTRDVGRAHRVSSQLNAGVTWVNCHHRNGPDAPWGGFGASGVGRENGRDAQDAYTASKTLVVRTADQPEDWFGGDARYG